MNLLGEIKAILKINNKNIEDIEWIGTSKNYVNIEKFLDLANTEYDDGYGAPEVAQNLLIVGKDWWLERNEYDGSEWFEFKEMIKKPLNYLDIKAITVKQSEKLGINYFCGWRTLEEINEVEEDII